MNETIAEIRKVREQISKDCGYDSKRLVDFYIERQKKRSQQGGFANSDTASVVPPSAPSE